MSQATLAKNPSPEQTALKLVEAQQDLSVELNKAFNRLAEFSWAGWKISAEGYAHRQVYLTEVSAAIKENGQVVLFFATDLSTPLVFANPKEALAYVKEIEQELANAD